MQQEPGSWGDGEHLESECENPPGISLRSELSPKTFTPKTGLKTRKETASELLERAVINGETEPHDTGPRGVQVEFGMAFRTSGIVEEKTSLLHHDFLKQRAS